MKSVNKYEEDPLPAVHFHLLIAKKNEEFVVRLLTQIYIFLTYLPHTTRLI